MNTERPTPEIEGMAALLDLLTHSREKILNAVDRVVSNQDAAEEGISKAIAAILDGKARYEPGRGKNFFVFFVGVAIKQAKAEARARTRHQTLSDDGRWIECRQPGRSQDAEEPEQCIQRAFANGYVRAILEEIVRMGSVPAPKKFKTAMYDRASRGLGPRNRQNLKKAFAKYVQTTPEDEMDTLIQSILSSWQDRKITHMAIEDLLCYLNVVRLLRFCAGGIEACRSAVHRVLARAISLGLVTDGDPAAHFKDLRPIARDLWVADKRARGLAEDEISISPEETASPLDDCYVEEGERLYFMLAEVAMSVSMKFRDEPSKASEFLRRACRELVTAAAASGLFRHLEILE